MNISLFFLYLYIETVHNLSIVYIYILVLDRVNTGTTDTQQHSDTPPPSLTKLPRVASIENQYFSEYCIEVCTILPSVTCERLYVM